MSSLDTLENLQRISQVCLIENTVVIDFFLIPQYSFATDCFSSLFESRIPNGSVKMPYSIFYWMKLGFIFNGNHN